MCVVWLGGAAVLVFLAKWSCTATNEGKEKKKNEENLIAVTALYLK